MVIVLTRRQPAGLLWHHRWQATLGWRWEPRQEQRKHLELTIPWQQKLVLVLLLVLLLLMLMLPLFWLRAGAPFETCTHRNRHSSR